MELKPPPKTLIKIRDFELVHTRPMDNIEDYQSKGKQRLNTILQRTKEDEK